MLIQVLAAFLLIAASCVADDNGILNQLHEPISENHIDELLGNNDKNEAAAAVRYMIPVPIRVMIPVPQPRPYRRPYPDREEIERDPIVAVPIGATPGRFGPVWRPIGPPVIAVPIGSASPYPLPDAYDDYDYERHSLAMSARAANAPRVRGAAVVRKTRSVDDEELKADEHEQGELTADMWFKEVQAKGFRGNDNPLKVSTKTGSKRFKSLEKRFRPKRQLGAYYVRGGYVRPTRVIVPAQPSQVVVAPVPVSNTQVVPVPVYVPVPVETAI